MAGSSSAYSGESGGMITDINVTPLVDVVLVLLIVMMITMPTIVSVDIENEREMAVELPEAGAAMPLIAKPKDLFVNVSRTGEYTVSQEKYDLKGLAELLRQAHANNPGRASVVIRADKACHWQAVVNVMDLCNAAKIRNYKVSTQ